MQIEFPQAVKTFFKERNNYVTFVKENDENLLIAFLVCSFMSYFVIRYFKNFPLRTMFHRVFSLLAILIAIIIAFILRIKGK